MQNNETIRKFIRHPSDVPIQVTLAGLPGKADKTHDVLNNVSLGGLAFLSIKPLPLASQVHVYFPIIDYTHCFNGKVVWVKEFSRGFDTGIQFDSADELYRLRMIQQVCHVEHYRGEVARRDGREISSEEAAKEWIKLYAGVFPGLEA